MNNITTELVTKNNRLASQINNWDAVYGSLRNLRTAKSYWFAGKDEQFHTFRRRVGKRALAPTKGEIEFRDDLLRIAVEDKRMAPFEKKFSENFGPFNFENPDDLLENLSKYYGNPNAVMGYLLELDPKLNDTNLSLLSNCFKEVFDELHKVMQPSDRALTLYESYESLPTGTNSGLPYYTSKKWTEEMAEDYISRAEAVVKGDSNVLFPYVLQHRLQTKGLDVTKARCVWSPDKAELIAAGKVTRPMLDLMKRLPQYQGYNGVHTLTDVFYDMFDNYHKFISLDFSNFDATIAPIMVKLMMKVVSKLFPGNEALCNALVNYYISGDILVPTQNKQGVELWKGIHGVPSGIGATYLTSLINRAVVKFCMYKQGIPTHEYFHMANGDDTVLALSEWASEAFNLQTLSETMADLGLIVNPDERKQEISEKGKTTEFSEVPYVTFLGRYFFMDDCRGKMPIMRMAPNLYFQERYMSMDDLLVRLDYDEIVDGDKDAFILAADCIGVIQKMENCANHDNHEAMVHYILEQCDGMLDVNLWHIPKMDAVAKAVRSGRLSAKLGVLDYKTVKSLVKRQVELVNENSKTIAQISNSLFSKLPQYKRTPDMRSKTTQRIKVKGEAPKKLVLQAKVSDDVREMINSLSTLVAPKAQVNSNVVKRINPNAQEKKPKLVKWYRKRQEILKSLSEVGLPTARVSALSQALDAVEHNIESETNVGITASLQIIEDKYGALL